MSANEDVPFPFYAQLKRALRKITTDIAAHVAASDPHAQYMTNAEVLAVKIDDLTAGDDNTDLNASTAKHGLLRKLDNVATNYLDGTGNWSVPAGGGGGSFTPDFGIWLPDAPPASAGADDDEFDGASGGVPTGWTEVDHGTHMTVDEDEAGLKLFQATHAGDSVSGVYKAIPAGNFTIWTKVSLSGDSLTNYNNAGLALWEDATSSAGDLASFTLSQNATSTNIQADRWTAYNAYGAALASRIVTVDAGVSAIYLRIRRTGTTYSMDYSTDGVGWQPIYSSTLTFTPTHYGPAINNVNTGVDSSARFPFFRYVASDVGITGLVSGDRVGMARA